MSKEKSARFQPDLIAVIVLIALWVLFFWRLLTPVVGDQASLKQGDFSGQFVAFGAYQYQRLTQGEIPLWNPYNNGGFPFIADSQSAVFYPPRLLSIGLAHLTDGWTYHTLELEMIAHVLLYSLMVYGLIRRMTLGQSETVIGALGGAIIASYNGYITGYPPLQLALLEAGIWLPLGVLGILEATRHARVNWHGVILAGFALGMSWLAGHPQTSWFLTYLLVAYWIYRGYQQRFSKLVLVGGIAGLAVLSFGLSAVQLIPGFEYLPQTARADFGYDSKGNGFPLYDVIQFILPNVLTVFSPMYIGVIGLIFAIIALSERVKDYLFWGGVVLVGLGLSFGANSAVFPLFYNTLPGLRFFRGQERAIYLVVNSLAILASLGFVHLLSHPLITEKWRKIRLSLSILSGVLGVLVIALFIASLADHSTHAPALNSALFSLSMVVGLLLLFGRLALNLSPLRIGGLIVCLLAFELFTVNLDAPSNYDPIPADQQIGINPPPLVQAVLADEGPYFRVDGWRGVGDNYGSLYRVSDIRGISPLFLASPFEIIQPEMMNPLAWELFAVKYVYSDWEQLPVEAQIIQQGQDRYGEINLHQLLDPRPFAHWMTDFEVIDSDAFAYALLTTPNFNPRQTLILNKAPELSYPDDADDSAIATIRNFSPETVTIDLQTSENALLSLALVNYNGWRAYLDGEQIPLYRAYGALSAVEIPAGEHELVLTYAPLSFQVGALLTILTMLFLVGWGLYQAFYWQRGTRF